MPPNVHMLKFLTLWTFHLVKDNNSLLMPRHFLLYCLQVLKMLMLFYLQLYHAVKHTATSKLLTQHKRVQSQYLLYRMQENFMTFIVIMSTFIRYIPIHMYGLLWSTAHYIIKKINWFWASSIINCMRIAELLIIYLEVWNHTRTTILLCAQTPG